MRLFEHQDFSQAILAAAKHFGDRIDPSIIEKDYYVTEALRILSEVAYHHVIFKGGTSLSKGWGLIDRFSEDIDIFLDPQSFSEEQSRNALDRELKNLRDAVGTHPALEFFKTEPGGTRGIKRGDHFAYQAQHPGIVKNNILLELNITSGNKPFEVVTLRSLLVKYLDQSHTSLRCEDEESFELRLLHYRRTFVEKMFAIHSRIQLYQKQGIELGTYVRHYYDLAKLAELPDILEMLKSDEYTQIKESYDKISSKYYPDHYFAPENMSFSNSEALYPPDELASIIQKQYETECQKLCYEPHPPWGQVMQLFQDLRSLL